MGLLHPIKRLRGVGVGAGFAVVLDHFEQELVVFDGVGDGEEGDGVAGHAAGDFAEGEGGFVGVGLVGHDVGLHAILIQDGGGVGLKVPHDADGLKSAVLHGEPDGALPFGVGEGIGAGKRVGASVVGAGRRWVAGGIGDLGGCGGQGGEEGEGGEGGDKSEEEGLFHM